MKINKVTYLVCIVTTLLISCNHNKLSVTTLEVSNVQDIAVLCGGFIPDFKVSAISHYGICWSESPNPTLKRDNIVESGFKTNNKGTFTVWLHDLLPEHTYYIRAFAVDANGVSYGEVVCVTTKSQFHDTYIENAVQDYDGNSYDATQLGDQTWMASNLKTTHYADGSYVFEGQYSTNDAAKYPNGNPDNVEQYGFLYNIVLATRGEYSAENSNPSGVQGVCPNGWHLPSLAEWEQLETYLESHSNQYIKPSGSIAKALASTEEWPSSATNGAPGNNPSLNNSTGFSALPAGEYETGWGTASHEYFQQKAAFAATNAVTSTMNHIGEIWSSSNASISNTSSKFNYGILSMTCWTLSWGHSVRCVKD